MKYDANNIIDAKSWLAQDENDRFESISQYHKKLKIKLPNIRLHTLFHVIIENQLAEGIKEVLNKLDELMADGLNRHDAIHAIGCVLSEHMFILMKEKPDKSDLNQEYYNKLSKLTAQSWLDQFKE
jgi:hypothetical protein